MEVKSKIVWKAKEGSRSVELRYRSIGIHRRGRVVAYGSELKIQTSLMLMSLRNLINQ